MRDIDPEDQKQRRIVAQWESDVRTNRISHSYPADLLRNLKEYLNRPEPRFYAHPSDHWIIMERVPNKPDKEYAKAETMARVQNVVDALNFYDDRHQNAMTVDSSHKEAVIPEHAKIGDLWFGGQFVWIKTNKNEWHKMILDWNTSVGNHSMRGALPYKPGDIK